MLQSMHRDIIRIVAMNLDVQSFFNLYSTCKICKNSLIDRVHEMKDWCSCSDDITCSAFLKQILMSRMKLVKHEKADDCNYSVVIRIDDNEKNINIPNGRSYLLYVQTYNNSKVRDTINFVVKQRPHSIRIDPFSDEFCNVLQDEDTKLLHDIEHVYLQKNTALTDATLTNVRKSVYINICRRHSIQGKLLPFLMLDPSTKLYNIRWMRGYGVHNRPFGPHCDDNFNFLPPTPICKWMRRQAQSGTIIQE